MIRAQKITEIMAIYPLYIFMEQILLCAIDVPILHSAVGEHVGGEK